MNEQIIKARKVIGRGITESMKFDAQVNKMLDESYQIQHKRQLESEGRLPAFKIYKIT